jgi:hypothetical protein
MVRALLDGSKTQTRREFKARGWQAAVLRTLEFVHVLHGAAAGVLSCAQPVDTAWAGFRLSPDSTSPLYFKCPYGQPGDRLWVRETWAEHPDFPGCRRAIYRADPECEYDTERWNPSIHMPRWASRILLEIVSVRVERLQDISEADARAEGITPHEVRQFAIFGASEEERAAIYRDAAVGPYRGLWQQINGPGSWGANPWVWVVEFRRVP